MSTAPAVTRQDLEFEHAELLPGRETLCVCNQSYTKQFAFLSGNNIASGDNVQINGINLLGQQGGGQSASATSAGNLTGL
jgi:hypothetical protein